MPYWNTASAETRSSETLTKSCANDFGIDLCSQLLFMLFSVFADNTSKNAETKQHVLLFFMGNALSHQYLKLMQVILCCLCSNGHH